jgi:hypothetical protein
MEKGRLRRLAWAKEELANGFSRVGRKPEMRGEKDFLFLFFFSNIPKPFSNSF